MAESLNRRQFCITGAPPPWATSTSNVVIIRDIEPSTSMMFSGLPVVFPDDAKYEPPKYDRTLNREQRRKMNRRK
jgi:hypothetical protein